MRMRVVEKQKDWSDVISPEVKGFIEACQKVTPHNWAVALERFKKLTRDEQNEFFLFQLSQMGKDVYDLIDAWEMSNGMCFE